jgi:hypothetical protein
LPIPDDELNREWIQMIDEGPNKVLFDQFRASLVAFLAFSREREAAFAGTGLIIAGADKFAVILTAKHVLDEGVLRIQRPESVSSNGFAPAHFRTPDLNLKKLNLTWVGRGAPSVLTVIHAQYCDEFDLAVCVATPLETSTTKFEPVDVPLELRVPSVGDRINIVAFEHFEAVEKEIGAPPDYHIGQHLMLGLRIGIRTGTVTGVYPDGLRHYHWPCITTSIPVEPGMSGGFAFHPRNGVTIAALGVVCADSSADDSRGDFRIAGESIVALSWPGLALEVPTSNAAGAERLTLHQMMTRGNLRAALGGIERFEIVALSEGVRQLHLRR